MLFCVDIVLFCCVCVVISLMVWKFLLRVGGGVCMRARVCGNLILIFFCVFRFCFACVCVVG